MGFSQKLSFPLLEHDPVVFLDSAASTQKPREVLECEKDFYERHYANIHRGVYRLSERATEKYEAVRGVVRGFLNAQSIKEIIFTKGATEGINLVCHSWGEENVSSGDEIVISILDHHSNFVPWQQLAKRKGAKLKVIGLDDKGFLSREEFSKALSPKTKIVSLTHIANAYGLKLPVEELFREAHSVGAKVLLDAAQSAPRMRIDVKALDADFLVLSGHKMYGPTGTGVLYGREALLEQMPPFLFGGDMIRHVRIDGTDFNDLPHKFEAGTPNIAGIVAMGRAFEFLNDLGMSQVEEHENTLVKKLETMLDGFEGLRTLGPQGCHSGLVCFDVDGVHSHDVAQYLDRKNIAVRAGHHCAQPLLEYLNLEATTRASLGVYNTEADIDALEEGLRETLRFFRR